MGNDPQGNGIIPFREDRPLCGLWSMLGSSGTPKSSLLGLIGGITLLRRGRQSNISRILQATGRGRAVHGEFLVAGDTPGTENTDGFIVFHGFPPVRTVVASWFGPHGKGRQAFQRSSLPARAGAHNDGQRCSPEAPRLTIAGIELAILMVSVKIFHCALACSSPSARKLHPPASHRNRPRESWSNWTGPLYVFLVENLSEGVFACV